MIRAPFTATYQVRQPKVSRRETATSPVTVALSPRKLPTLRSPLRPPLRLFPRQCHHQICMPNSHQTVLQLKPITTVVFRYLKVVKPLSAISSHIWSASLRSTNSSVDWLSSSWTFSARRHWRRSLFSSDQMLSS